MISTALAQSVSDAAPVIPLFKIGFWNSLALLCISGFIGGMIGGISKIILPDSANKLSIRFKSTVGRQICKCWFWVVMRGITGSAISLGFIFIVVFLPVLAGLTIDQQKGFFIGSGLLVGLFSEKIMPILERNLIEKIEARAEQAVQKSQAATDKVEEANTTAQSANKSADSALTIAENAVSKAEVAASEGQLLAASKPTALPSSAQLAASRAEELLKKDAGLRTLSIVLANVYFLKLKEIEKANAVLINLERWMKQHRPEGWEIHYADSLYNRACYLVSSAEEDDEEASTRKYEPTEAQKKQATLLLAESFSYNSINKKDAQVDPDLSVLKSYPGFIQLFADTETR
jgi:hypothetical protein